jgi:hypothetical protein
MMVQKLTISVAELLSRLVKMSDGDGTTNNPRTIKKKESTPPNGSFEYLFKMINHSIDEELCLSILTQLIIKYMVNIATLIGYEIVTLLGNEKERKKHKFSMVLGDNDGRLFGFFRLTDKKWKPHGVYVRFTYYPKGTQRQPRAREKHILSETELKTPEVFLSHRVKKDKKTGAYFYYFYTKREFMKTGFFVFPSIDELFKILNAITIKYKKVEYIYIDIFNCSLHITHRITR